MVSVASLKLTDLVLFLIFTKFSIALKHDFVKYCEKICKSQYSFDIINL